MTDLRGQTEADGIKATIQRELQKMRTGVPAVIVSFDASNQMAVVKPLIRRFTTVDDEQKTVEMPDIVQVPIIQPRAGDFALTFPVEPGDEVMLQVSDRPLDTWIDSGGVQDPQQPVEPRHNHITDSVAFLGATPIPKALRGYSTGGVEIRTVDRSVRIAVNKANVKIQTGRTSIDVLKNGNVVIDPDGNVIVEQADVQVNSGTVKVTDGDVIADGISLKNHTHPYNWTDPGGSSNTGKPS